MLLLCAMHHRYNTSVKAGMSDSETIFVGPGYKLFCKKLNCCLGNLNKILKEFQTEFHCLLSGREIMGHVQMSADMQCVVLQTHL